MTNEGGRAPLLHRAGRGHPSFLPSGVPACWPDERPHAQATGFVIGIDISFQSLRMARSDFAPFRTSPSRAWTRCVSRSPRSPSIRSGCIQNGISAFYVDQGPKQSSVGRSSAG